MIPTQDNEEHKCYYMIEVSHPNETNTRLNIEALGNLPSNVVNDIREILDKHYDSTTNK